MERRYANEDRDLDGGAEVFLKWYIEWRYATEEKDLDVVNLPRHEENETMGVGVGAKSMIY